MGGNNGYALGEDGEDIVEDGFDSDWEQDMDDEDLCDNMVDLGVHNGHSEDEEWIPDSVKTRRARAQGKQKGVQSLSQSKSYPLTQ